ncbi:NF-kappa-B essential modulator isoform X2 [Musca domestica]|uniref:NF-kappa-B essential modulator isoform X2 n=1 Tax=Musca domestica TaxID=7370 RepID=A0A1I8MC75_MUSDO|nr:NF-kappa-B essential modulator isoform X2 [Musca domestica]
MSEEESFVILGSSPVPSMEYDGGDRNDSGADVSLQSDTPGSCFTSLKSSQLGELQNARQSSNKTPTPSTSINGANEAEINDVSKETPLVSDSKEKPQTSMSTSMQRSAESILWSRPQVDVKSDFLPISLEEFAVQSPLERSPKTSLNSRPPPSPPNMSGSYNSNNKENIQPNEGAMNVEKNMTSSQNNGQTAVSSKATSLASSFILGEVNADALKSSVYSQFPSISMKASPEDVMKLQTMCNEYVQLKSTLEKVHNTMSLFYKNSLEWKEKMNIMENHYKEQLSDCQNQIEALRAENLQLKKSIDVQVEQTKAVDLARQKDREDMIKTISEKNSLVENMRAQIVKLEQQNTATFEFLPKKHGEKSDTNFDNLYITRGEHDHIVKDLKRQLSELLAKNLDIQDMEKNYIDELNFLKVNLTAAEELVAKMRSEIAELKAADITKQNEIEELKRNADLLLNENTIQNERIILLEQQNEVHRRDFEMERESRQTAVGEKTQVLQDLRALQKRNQELLEERQKLIENYERRVSTMSSSSSGSLVAAAAAAQTYLNNPQRPIRELTANSTTNPTATGALLNCPICNKTFKSLSVLQSHVNDCIDRT